MKDKIIKIVLFSSSIISILLIVGIICSLVIQSIPAISHFGFLNFIFSSEWDSREMNENYGALAFIFSTVCTAILALLISLPFSFSLTILNGEYLGGTKFALFLNNVIHFFSCLPSIILGIWGYYYLRPLFVSWSIGTLGLSILTASVILAIMIIPLTSSLCISFISTVPLSLKEAAYSLGGTRYDVITKICLPHIKKKILAAYILAFGRALGETMIIVILIGNNNHIPTNITDTGNTLSSIILLQFGAVSDLKFSSLYTIGLLLFTITAIVNLTAKYMLKELSYEIK